MKPIKNNFVSWYNKSPHFIVSIIFDVLFTISSTKDNKLHNVLMLRFGFPQDAKWSWRTSYRSC